jgi:TolB-like protein
MEDLLTRTQAALADRYTVEREIGRGGMATVFLAEEHHPRRKVAIKVLTPDVATRLLRERFLREVNLASTLTHPHIVPVFAAGEADGLLYFVMPFIEGESLRQRITRQRTMAPRDAVELTREVASALHYAHGLGVIHRDIKPENILLAEGLALVADFGIARALGMAGGDSLTQAGMAVGTPAYMSPEQAEGRRDVDGRTDVYSLACVLLEMLGGSPPRRQSPEGRLQSMRKSLGTVSGSQVTRGGVESVLRKALAVEPEERFLSAQEFRAALDDPDQVGSAAHPRKRAIGIGALVGAVAVSLAVVFGMLVPGQGGAETPERVVVAVFENQTGDPGLSHLGPMASDWITQGLAQTGLLDVVVARAGLADDPSEGATEGSIRRLADETGAAIVVSGAYYRQGEQVQFQTRLTDAEENRMLLALNPVAAPVDSPLVAVELLRQRVMGALATLVDDRLGDWATSFNQPPSYDAYRQYVEGMTQFMRLQPTAISHLLRAAELDSTFISPLLMAAFVYGTQEQWEQADSLAQIVSLSRDKLSPLDRHQLDWVTAVARGDLQTALVAIRAAAEISGSESQLFRAVTAMWVNRQHEALDALRLVDPERGFTRDLFVYWTFVAGTLHQLGRHREELQAARRGKLQFPNNRVVLESELRALAAIGEPQQWDSLWDRFASSPTHPQFDGVGDVMRKGALESRLHGDGTLADEMIQRSLAWFRSLQPDEAVLERNRYGMARALYVAGQYDESQELFVVLARERPDSIGYVGYLAAVEARRGDREAALRVDASLDGMRRPYLFGEIPFWHARIAAILGDRETAVEYLHQADVEGRRFDLGDEFNVDLMELRGYQPYHEWTSPKDGER